MPTTRPKEEPTESLYDILAECARMLAVCEFYDARIKAAFKRMDASGALATPTLMSGPGRLAAPPEPRKEVA